MQPQTDFFENVISGQVNFGLKLNGETIDPSGSIVNIVSYTTISSEITFNVPSGEGQLQFFSGSSNGELTTIFINQGEINDPVNTLTLSGQILTDSGILYTLVDATSPYTTYTGGVTPVSYASNSQCIYN
jgi:hypothetical protein